jgi:hypothetical protein
MTALTPRQQYINSQLQLWYEFRVNVDRLAVALAKVGMDYRETVRACEGWVRAVAEAGGSRPPQTEEPD